MGSRSCIFGIDGDGRTGKRQEAKAMGLGHWAIIFGFLGQSGYRCVDWLMAAELAAFQLVDHEVKRVGP